MANHSMAFLDALRKAGAALALAVGSSFFKPARDAVIPRILDSGDLMQGNALVTTSTTLGYIERRSPSEASW